MQFKQPEILYFLIALIIPILVHLFQLQKFKKTVFTNVAFLQKIVQQNRKSSQLKKWLLLLSRLLLFSALIIAFSQPYFSNKKELRNSTVFIYLDNSLSMSSNGEKGELLKNAIQEIIENSNLKTNYSLLTNSSFYRNINANELKNQLLKLNSEAKSLSFKELFLKINTLINDKTNTLDKLILISDFQKYKNGNSIDFTNVTSRFSFVQLNSEQKNNLSIDSLFIKRQNNNDFIINILVRNQGDDKKNIPIAVFNQNQLVAKQSFSIQKDQVKTILFPIQNSQEFFGKITLDFNDTFSFDNSFYFSLNATEKINVLSIGETNEFLSKIYSKNEFNFNTSSVKNIDYNSLQKQQLIILNELNSLSPTLTEYLEKHIATGGSIAIIPHITIDINSYNRFFNQFNMASITNKQNDSLQITKIHFTHPFFKNVFSKSVENFQYPFAKNSYRKQSITTNSLLSFENQQDFISQTISGNGKIYWISASLNNENSNFINSPLVVPLFYNFGKHSLQSPQIYYTIGNRNTIDISTTVGQNEILSISNANISFIPQQQIFANRIKLKTDDRPEKSGLYTVKNKDKIIKTIAFNNNNNESLLQFLDVKQLINTYKKGAFSNSIKETFQEINKKNEVTWLWKWFLALAIVSLCFEIMILKFFKP